MRVDLKSGSDSLLDAQAFSSVTGYRDAHYRIGGGVVWGKAIVYDVERNVREDFRSALEGMIPSAIATCQPTILAWSPWVTPSGIRWGAT